MSGCFGNDPIDAELEHKADAQIEPVERDKWIESKRKERGEDNTEYFNRRFLGEFPKELTKERDEK